MWLSVMDTSACSASELNFRKNERVIRFQKFERFNLDGASLLQDSLLGTLRTRLKPALRSAVLYFFVEPSESAIKLYLPHVRSILVLC